MDRGELEKIVGKKTADNLHRTERLAATDMPTDKIDLESYLQGASALAEIFRRHGLTSATRDLEQMARLKKKAFEMRENQDLFLRLKEKRCAVLSRRLDRAEPEVAEKIIAELKGLLKYGFGQMKRYYATRDTKKRYAWHGVVNLTGEVSNAFIYTRHRQLAFDAQQEP